MIRAQFLTPDGQPGGPAFDRRLTQLIDATRAAAQREVRKAAMSTAKIARQLAPKATGKLKSATEGIVVDQTELKTRLMATVRVLPKYAPFVEGVYYEWNQGRAAGRWPPADAIMAWVRVKGLAAKWFGRETAQTLESATFLVRRAIGQHGTPAHPFLMPAFEQVRPQFEAGLSRIFTEAGKQAGFILGHPPGGGV